MHLFRLILLYTLLAQVMLATSPAMAQAPAKGSGRISGRIIDSLSKEPVEYATISLVEQASNKIVNGTTTDDKGLYKLADISDGTYKLMVYFIGYKTALKTNITIKNNNAINTGDIGLSNQQTTLQEVTVSTERSLIENKIDKMVYNAEKDVTSQGGVATDILKKVPQVSVDVNGNVELQGNANIRFLINGKPSTVFGGNLVDVLQSIPASQIQSIEVITSPGARYDAEGTGGIINIILKKSTAQGINGNVSLSGGTRLENGSLNLNARKGDFGVNAFASGNAQLTSTTLNTMNRVSTDPSTQYKSTLLQDGSSDFNRNGYQAGLSADWSITPKDNLTGGVSYNYFGNNTKGTTTRQSITQDASAATISDITNLVDATNNAHANTVDWNLNYKKSFSKEDQELDILYSASDASNYSYYQQVQRYASPDSVYNGSYGKNPGTELQTNIAINYVQPIGKKVLLETGAKTVMDNIHSQADVFLLSPSSSSYDFSTTQSNTIHYNRSIYAGYLSGTFKLNVIDIKAGCRYEYTDTKADFSTGVGTVQIPQYSSWVPSAVISRSFKKNNTIKLSYTHRIQRPDYRDLNPFVNSSDPKNLSAGNPNLKPEIADNIELGYNKFFEKGTNINVALFYRGTSNDIQSYTVYYPSYTIGDSTYSNVAISTRENIGLEHNFGLNVFASVPVTSKINIRTNISSFQRYIINKIVPGSNISGFNYRVNVNASYQVTETLIIELFGNFNSSRLNVQGRMPSFTTYNFALRKQFWHKKASFALTATNPFNKYVPQKTDLSGTDFTSYSMRKLPYRSFGINFTYKFGKLEFKKEKPAEDINLTNPPMGN